MAVGVWVARRALLKPAWFKTSVNRF